MLVLTTEYKGECYLGALLCHDAEFAQKLYDFLKQHVGEPMREIAELDILREL